VKPDDPSSDPRCHRLPPTAAEVDAWAEREHARRAAWLQGPTALERADWASSQERAGPTGSGPASTPAPEAIDAWADRVRQARQAWLDGPSDEEKRKWARGWTRAHGGPPPELAPLPEEAEAWAREENQRRREWLAGPTEAEKLEWTRRQSAPSLIGRWLTASSLASERELASSLLHEIETAGAETLGSLARASHAFWTYLKRAGRRIEERAARAPRRRVPYS
jgi:hypothetical protein